ncbi:ankyrin repeat-containing domain protein, partial [Ochromonadaceae sp. CCMP2298]
MRENGKAMRFAPQRSTSELSDPSQFIGFALSGDLARVRELVSTFPDLVNMKESEHGNVALHVAASKGNEHMSNLLLSLGANDIFGNSPLHYAVDKKRDKLVELLIRCGADVNLRDYRGNTPLHAACANNDIDIVRLLLLHHADPLVGNLDDLKPAQKTTLAA